LQIAAGGGACLPIRKKRAIRGKKPGLFQGAGVTFFFRREAGGRLVEWDGGGPEPRSGGGTKNPPFFIIGKRTFSGGHRFF